MRKTLGVAALTLALCAPALAGEIPNPPAPQPQGVTASEPTTTDEDTTGAAETLTRIAFVLVSGVLPLL